MKSNAYTPRADSLASQCINFFRYNPDEELMLDDIHDKFTCTRGNIHTLLKPAVEAGLLFRAQNGDGEWYYAKGHNLQDDADAHNNGKTSGTHALPEIVARTAPAAKGFSSPRHTIDIDALEVEQGIPFTPDATGGKWDPLFSKLTKAGQSVAVPGHVKNAIAAAIAKRRKDKAGGTFKVGITSPGQARLWRLS